MINGVEMYKKWGCKIKLGDWTEWLIDKITFGNGSWYAYKVAIFFGYSDCGCERRRIKMNKWTCKDNTNE